MNRALLALTHTFGITSSSGKEPRRLYYLIEFMICDKDGGGTMSEDECAEVRSEDECAEVMSEDECAEVL